MAKIFLTPEELSERWKLPLSTLDQWRWYRKGPPFVRMGKRIRYTIKGIEDFESQVVQTNTCYEKNTICPNINIFK